MGLNKKMLEKDLRFNRITEQIDSPEYSQELREQLFKGVEKVYTNPPYKEASIVLGLNLTPAQTQQMLFFPKPKDMSFYPILISSPPGYDSRFPSATVCFRFFCKY